MPDEVHHAGNFLARPQNIEGVETGASISKSHREHAAPRRASVTAAFTNAIERPTPPLKE